MNQMNDQHPGGNVDFDLHMVTMPSMLSSNEPPRAGTFLLKSRLTGDHFYQFVILNLRSDGRAAVERSSDGGGYELCRINGYSSATLPVATLSQREYHLLLAGEEVDLYRFKKTLSVVRDQLRAQIRALKEMQVTKRVVGSKLKTKQKQRATGGESATRKRSNVIEMRVA